MRRTSSQAWEAAGVPVVTAWSVAEVGFRGEGVKGAAPAVRDVGDVGVEGGALTRRRELVVRVRHAHHVHGRAAGTGGGSPPGAICCSRAARNVAGVLSA